MAQLKELPFDVEAPGKPNKSMPMMPERDEPAEGGEGAIPGYVEPWERCANCKYFQAEEDEQMCNKFKAPADMDGSCPSFEEGDAGGKEEEAAEGDGEEGEEVDA